jgi:TolB-like protein
MRKDRKLLSVIVMLMFAVLFTTNLHAKKKMRIAMLELTPLSVTAELATGVTDLVVTELVNCGQFEVLERMQVVKILNEQGFQQTGVTDTSKAIEAGKLLNADTVMIGTLQKFNTSFVLNVKIVDVNTGKIMFADKQVAKDNDKLIDASSLLVNSLVRRITGNAPKYHVKPAYNSQAAQKVRQAPTNSTPGQLPTRVFYAKRKSRTSSSYQSQQKGALKENRKDDPDQRIKENARRSQDELDRETD